MVTSVFRFALDDLQQWLHQNSRNPLAIRGARQVGKTWLVRELARSTALDLLEINFELDPAKKHLFSENDPRKVLLALEIIQVFCRLKLNPGKKGRCSLCIFL